MTKQKIIIEDFKNKVSKKGDVYAVFETNKGAMSCFEEDLIKDLKNVMQRTIIVEIAESKDGAFTNIRGCDGLAEDEDPMEPIGKPSENKTFAKAVERKSVKGSAYEKDPVGLAVEIFNALITQTNELPAEGGQIMDSAISLVKQAQEAF